MLGGMRLVFPYLIAVARQRRANSGRPGCFRKHRMSGNGHTACRHASDPGDSGRNPAESPVGSTLSRGFQGADCRPSYTVDGQKLAISEEPASRRIRAESPSPDRGGEPATPAPLGLLEYVPLPISPAHGVSCHDDRPRAADRSFARRPRWVHDGSARRYNSVGCRRPGQRHSTLNERERAERRPTPGAAQVFRPAPGRAWLP
jgi:hypothetical protein